jgi:hypothetical protein
MMYKGRGQFFDRAPYPPLTVQLALEAAPQPAWDVISFSWIQCAKATTLLADKQARQQSGIDECQQAIHDQRDSKR